MWPGFLMGGDFSFEKTSATRDWLCVSLLLLALNAFSLNLGCISPIFSRFCGLLLIISVMLIHGSTYRNISKCRELFLGSVLILTSLLILLISSMVELWIISLSIFITGLYLTLRSAQKDLKELSALSLGVTLYAAFYIICSYIPQLWFGVSKLSISLTGLIGRLMGEKLALGPSISGFWIYFTFFFCTVAFFLLSKKIEINSWKIFLKATSVMIMVQTGYIIMTCAFPQMASDRSNASFYLLFLLLIIPFIYFKSFISDFNISEAFGEIFSLSLLIAPKRELPATKLVLEA